MPKLIMFGPGLETTTSCLVTSLLWKSEFEACGMIPGKDGYGSGIKLKLFNHRAFNLTILYTNVSKIRHANTNRLVLNANRLLLTKWNETSQAHEYEVTLTTLLTLLKEIISWLEELNDDFHRRF